MDKRRLLRELGLTKYETDAYLNILERGMVEASTINKEAKIPFGKIYETLNMLASKGLIDVQNTRPKKYKAKKPELAFDNLFKDKKEDMENDLQKTRETITQIREEITKIHTKQPKEKIFWTTAVGDEVGELIRSNFEEAEKEICILIYYKHQQTPKHQFEGEKLSIMNEVIKAIMRGVKVKALLSRDFKLQHMNVLKKFNTIEKTLKTIEIRIVDDPPPAHFMIIDSEKVVLRVDDPTDLNKILAIIKIWDVKLAKKLKDKFDEIWNESEPFELTQHTNSTE
ncbi:MAG: TrmB family transcriptional regulator [Methanosarcinales archaeon]|nr:MAG: TrmB family transcriptional regulator [Methanosarcinales archaeon]